MNRTRQIQKFRKNIESLIEQLESVITQELPQKGLTQKSCQRVYLLAKCQELTFALNGTEKEDFFIEATE